jgi:D-alanyl-lipoteichoic acid acyltransferase DltB (MBOAT superfamily)
MGLGMIATGVLFEQLSQRLLASQGAPWTAKMAQVLLLGPWGFYMSFAGNCCLMEVFSRFWGIDLPRSFDRPFGRRNLSEFWNSWNTTATRVFREYVFMARWGLKRPIVGLNILIVFLICGAWHGLNAYWLLWGALHGIAFWGFLTFRRKTSTWEVRIPARLGRALSQALTYLFVCSCWYLPSKLLSLV